MTLVADQLASYILGDTVVCPEVLIDTYKDSFVQVCKVVEDSSGNWMYAEINEDVMFDTHTSWVYFIVDNGIIKKVGETGLQLGIREFQAKECQEVQPISSTKCRFGRYRRHGGTDEFVRSSLSASAKAGTVTLWAHRCETMLVTHTIAGETLTLLSTVHKDLETTLIDKIESATGTKLPLNKVRK